MSAIVSTSSILFLLLLDKRRQHKQRRRHHLSYNYGCDDCSRSNDHKDDRFLFHFLGKTIRTIRGFDYCDHIHIVHCNIYSTRRSAYEQLIHFSMDACSIEQLLFMICALPSWMTLCAAASVLSVCQELLGTHRRVEVRFLLWARRRGPRRAGRQDRRDGNVAVILA